MCEICLRLTLKTPKRSHYLKVSNKETQTKHKISSRKGSESLLKRETPTQVLS